MKRHCLLLLLTAASVTLGQNVQEVIADIPDSGLEAAHQANPDDLSVTGRLLSYYSRENRDPNWSSRFALLSSTIQSHPDSSFLGTGQVYGDMPKSLRAQLNQLWIAQVQQHPDKARILRNAAAALDPAPAVIRIGGNVQKANILSQVAPEYPELAKQARIQGTVQFTATIGPEGNILNLQVVSGHPLLVQAAAAAVPQWHYKPTLLNGNPVTVITTIDVTFTLNGSAPNN